MAQVSIAAYFNTRKRAAVDDLECNRAKKVFIIDEGCGKLLAKATTENDSCQVTNIDDYKSKPNSGIDQVLPNKIIFKTRKSNRVASRTLRIHNSTVKGNEEISHSNRNTNIQNEMDKVYEKTKDVTVKAMMQKLSRSPRISKLQATYLNFQEYQNKLKEAVETTSKYSANSLKSQPFNEKRLNVQLRPQKHLSDKKVSVVSAENYFKKIEDEPSKPDLPLPTKYCCLEEMFRAIDIVSQLMYNRKETITLSRLKRAVENLTKKNLTNRHLAQIKNIFPEAFVFRAEKLRVFGSGKREEKWELVLIPQISGGDNLNSDTLLARRRVLHNKLLDKVKEYHSEFLMSLEPMVIPKEIKNWHSGFKIEDIPDIVEDSLPEIPVEMKIKSGQEVLQTVKEMIGCNRKMEQALERLKAEKETKLTEAIPDNTPVCSILKGIPKHLLEKVRQRQAAKALISMNNSADKWQEIYSRLPELARLTKNIFVSEKKSVLKLEDVVEKIGNCCRIRLTKMEMEEHIKLLVKEFPQWLVLHHSLDKIWFLKQTNRDADLNVIRNKLEAIVKEKRNQ